LFYYLSLPLVLLKQKNKVPKFQYRKFLREELREENLTKEECIDMLKCMLLIRNFEEMIYELRENKGRYGPMNSYILGQLISQLARRR